VSDRTRRGGKILDVGTLKTDEQQEVPLDDEKDRRRRQSPGRPVSVSTRSAQESKGEERAKEHLAR